MKFNIDVLAKLARIRLRDEEKVLLTKDLENILSYVEQINELTTTDIEPTSHVLSIENVYREDTAQDTTHTVEKVLEALPEYAKDGRFFRVPKVIEGIE